MSYYISFHGVCFHAHAICWEVNMAMVIEWGSATGLIPCHVQPGPALGQSLQSAELSVWKYITVINSVLYIINSYV